MDIKHTIKTISMVSVFLSGFQKKIFVIYSYVLSAMRPIFSQTNLFHQRNGEFKIANGVLDTLSSEWPYYRSNFNFINFDTG